MPAIKIHCGFYEIFGPNWEKVDSERALQIMSLMEKPEMMGEELSLFGFVGTSRADNAIGGFFAIQYQNALRHYDKVKRLDIKNDAPFERLFFIFFPQSGKLILQNKKFIGLPVSMEAVINRLTKAFAEVLSTSKVGYVLSINYPSHEDVPKEVFIQAFIRSERVDRLRISRPKSSEIPENMVYFNPQFDKNQVIRESHQHDYDNFEAIDIEASDNGDIKSTHIGKDLIRAGTPTLMKFVENNEEKVLQRSIVSKFELYVDVNAETISSDILRYIIEIIKREHGLPIDSPVYINSSGQMSVFGNFSQRREDDDKNEE